MKRHLFPILFLLIFSVFSLFSIFQPGMMQTHDGLWQVKRATVMWDELKGGQFPVRWAHNLDNGYGIPLFNFVYPGPYYFTAPLMSLGVVNITAVKIITFLSYVAGGLGIYFFFSKHRLVALTSAILYLLNPYQLVNIFVRGALGETLVMGLAPWAIISVRAMSHRRLRWYDPLPLALALISHNFLGLLLMVIMFVYGVIRLSWRRTLGQIVIALGLSSFFLLPMVAERGFLLSSHEGNFSFVWSDHFVYPWQLLYSRWDYWYSMPGYLQDGMTFQLGFASLAVVVLYLFWLIVRWNKIEGRTRLLRSFWFIAYLGIVFTTTPYSRFLWEWFPILQTMQFPWRLLGLSAIVMAIMTGKLLSSRVSRHRLSGMLIAIFLLFLAFVNTRNYHRPIKNLSAEEFKLQNDLYADKTTTSIRDEIMPMWSKVERYQPTNLRMFNRRLGMLVGNAEVNSATDNPGDLYFKATAENERAVAVYYHNYYPSWQATIDGKPMTIAPDEAGNIQIPLTQGVHDYHIYLGNTPLATLGNIISLVSLLVLIYLKLSSRAQVERS